MCGATNGVTDRIRGSKVCGCIRGQDICHRSVPSIAVGASLDYDGKEVSLAYQTERQRVTALSSSFSHNSSRLVNGHSLVGHDLCLALLRRPSVVHLEEAHLNDGWRVQGPFVSPGIPASMSVFP